MSSSLVIVGSPSGPAVSNRIGEIAAALHLAVSFQVHPSVDGVKQLLQTGTDCCFQLDAPESGTATELEDECAALGMAGRLPRFLAELYAQRLLKRVRLAWSWDFPDLTRIRHQQGGVADLVALLSRPESWGERKEGRSGTFYVSCEGILVFHLR